MESYDMEFEFASFGDVIWAKRYANEEDMLRIPEGHREGPFVVIGRNKKVLFCLYCSSKIDTKGVGITNLRLEDKELSLYKETYARLDQVRFIDKSRYIKRLSCLSTIDKENLQKMVDIAATKGCSNEFDLDIPNVPITKGDIVLYNDKRFLIIGEDSEKYEAFPLRRTNKKSKNNITINDELVVVDYNSLTSLSKSIHLRRINFINNDILRRVLAIYKNRLNELKLKNQVRRGSLIRLNNNLYYVYGEIGNQFMIFSVLPSANKNMCNIVIGDKNYYSDFSRETLIDKNDPNIVLMRTASDDEAEIIKKKRKTFVAPVAKDRNPNWYQKINLPEIQAGSVISATISGIDELFVVIVRAQDEVIALPLEQVVNLKYKNLFKINVLDSVKVNELDGFDLKEVLIAIQDIAVGFINKKKLRGMIKTLSEGDKK